MGRLLFAIATALAALSAPARAEDPQILGVIASNEAVPLTCEFGACTVDLSTFCLEETAAVPLRGTEYRIADAGAAPVTLVATHRSGATVRLPAADVASLTAARGNRAVRVEVSYAELAPRGLTEPRLTVGEGVSLIPAKLADRASQPFVAARIERTTGTLRDLAVPFVDRAAPGSAAVRLLNRLINGVPDDRNGDVADRQALWERTLQNAGRENRPGVPLAREAFERCAAVPGGGFLTFRECLASRHDALLDPLNRAYWDAAGTGI